MHDGSIAQGDSWVRDHLDGYVQWAKQHNSVFVLTFDEDDYSAGNQIATVFVGQQVQPGQYAEPITHYSVLRTLQDAFGLPSLGGSAAAQPILDIWTSDPNAPRPAFTLRCADLGCAADGSTSTAPAGSIIQWRWDWGDGAVTSDATTSRHSYASAGDYPVKLTVTDNQGVTAQVSQTASARAPVDSGVFAADAFNRSVSGGWGSADVGGAWSVAGTASAYSVVPGVASVVLQKAETRSVVLPAVSSSDTDLRVGVAENALASGNGLYLTVVGRRVAANAQYEGRARVRGDGSVLVSVGVLPGSSTATTLKSEVVASGVTMTAGATLNTRLQVTGINPSTVRWKVWTGATEPAGWQQTVTDSTGAVQAKGSIGITTYLSSGSTVAPVTVALSNLTARTTTAAPPANQPPTAAFTSSAADLTALFDGSASADPDGTVASYAWSFGDGSPAGTGVRPSHSYASAGTYPVRLTVTDDKGASAVVSHDVTVTAPPPVNQPPAAAFTSSAAGLVASFDGSASADPDGTVASYAWSFGDGSPAGTGVRPSHSYASAGTYPVRLTVTDDKGASAVVSHDVTVTAPVDSGVFAADAFNRSVSGGWGSADVGGAWSVAGTASAYSVVPGVASVVLQKAETRSVVLPAVSSSDTDLRVGVAENALASGNGLYLTVVGRRVAANAQYEGRARVRGDGSVLVSVGVLPGSSTATTLKSEVVASGVTVAAGATLNTRLQVTGTNPSTVRWKVWTGATEPAGWQQTVTDSTAAVQAKGSIGITTYLSSGSTVAPVTVALSNLTARTTTN